MSGHFLALGFEVRDAQALGELARQAVRLGDVHISGRKSLPGAAFGWDAGRGVEVWVTAELPEASDADPAPEPSMIACLPGYRSEHVVLVPAYKLTLHPERPGETFAHLRLPTGPAQAAVLNLWEHPRLPAAGADLPVRLAGLVMETDEAEQDSENVVRLMAGPDGVLTTADQFLTPLDRDGHAKVGGLVLDIQTFANFHTGRPLERWRVKVGELQFDLVGPPELRPQGLEPGRRVEALVWLHGFIDAKP